MANDIRTLLAAAVEHHRAGRLSDAMALYGQILQTEPDNADALHLLGIAMAQSGRAADGEALIRRALQINPHDPRFHHNLGRSLALQGRWQEAAACHRRATELAPDFADAWYHLGTALRETGALADAETAYRKTLAIATDNVSALIGLSRCLDKAGRFAEEAGYLRQAIQRAPPRSEAVNLAALNLGRVLGQLGQTAEAIAVLRRLLADDPGNLTARDHLIFCLLTSPSASNRDIAAELDAYAACGAAPPNPAFANARDPNRRLRIGYLSGGLRVNHNLLYVMVPLLRAHDRANVEIVLYGDVPYDDDAERPVRALADLCRDTTHLDDAALAGKIRQDGIDILVSLLGRGSRAPRHEVLFRRPAPIQMAHHWVGSTGIPAVDFWIGDEAAVPGGGDEPFHEAVLRLPHMFIFEPPSGAPPVAPLPAIANGYVTFGSFANTFKLNDDVFAAWAAILARVANARLVLKSEPFAEAATRRHVEDRLRRAGLPMDRVAILPPTATLADHLAQYARVDIALDTFPYTFGNTALEALWMGVPVVTLAGARFAARITLSILSAAGFAAFTAFDVSGYVDKAVELASDPTTLADWRQTARARIAGSPLMDYASQARALELAFRSAWTRWCNAPR